MVIHSPPHGKKQISIELTLLKGLQKIKDLLKILQMEEREHHLLEECISEND